MVVPQLVVRSLLTPEVRSSNSVIGKIYTDNCIEKTKIKMPGMAIFIKTKGVDNNMVKS